MRIIGGEFRSRKLVAPEGESTRPTLDQVRKAVFSSLGEFFRGGCLLDPFAGTGAIGFEALSRGVSQVLLADRDEKALKAIKQNMKDLKVEDKCTIWSYDYHKTFTQAYKKGLKFDFIYLDPPYELNKYEELLQLIVDKDLLNENGAVIVECLKQATYNDKVLVKYKEATYGIMKINYYKRSK